MVLACMKFSTDTDILSFILDTTATALIDVPPISKKLSLSLGLHLGFDTPKISFDLYSIIRQNAILAYAVTHYDMYVHTKQIYMKIGN